MGKLRKPNQEGTYRESTEGTQEGKYGGSTEGIAARGEEVQRGLRRRSTEEVQRGLQRGGGEVRRGLNKQCSGTSRRE